MRRLHTEGGGQLGGGPFGYDPFKEVCLVPGVALGVRISDKRATTSRVGVHRCMRHQGEMVQLRVAFEDVGGNA